MAGIHNKYSNIIDDARSHLESIKTRCRRWLGIELFIVLLVFCSVWGFILTNSESTVLSLISTLLLVVTGIVCFHQHNRIMNCLEPGQIARRLDNMFAELEYSSGLVLDINEKNEASLLYKLQQERIAVRIKEKNSKELKEACGQSLIISKSRILTVNLLLMLILSMAGNKLVSMSAEYFKSAIEQNSSQMEANSQEQLSETSASKNTIQWSLTIEPPKYTQIAPIEIKHHKDLEGYRVPENSHLTWRVKTNRPLAKLSLYAQSSGKKTTFSKYKPELIAGTAQQHNTNYQVTITASHSEIYSVTLPDASAIVDKSPMTEKQLNSSEKASILTRDKIVVKPLMIQVKADKEPVLHWILPQQSMFSFNPTQQPQLRSILQASDDYGITKVGLLATMAKGSGEAVKFRDLNLSFDSKEEIKKDNNKEPKPGPNQNPNAKAITAQVKSTAMKYQKNWNFVDLGMQPGDEIYIKAYALDNKNPQAQKKFSSTLIIKWLEEDWAETRVEGLSVPYKPEYFKSQRQIIIETEALIEQLRQSNTVDIESKSRALAYDQQALKLKYGQFLGDENGNPVVHSDAQQETDSHDDEEAHSQHAHTAERSNNGNSGSGSVERDALVSEFIHRHGSTEIGPLSNRDPKSWMKKAVASMWQAELELMLANPKAALPYEYDAYHALKLARAAEKIYVKRLGFEPPPVTEDNRLSGDIDSVPSVRLEREQLNLLNNNQDDMESVVGNLIQSLDPALRWSNKVDSKFLASEVNKLIGLLLSSPKGENSDRNIQIAARLQSLIETKSLKDTTREQLYEEIVFLQKQREAKISRRIDLSESTKAHSDD